MLLSVGMIPRGRFSEPTYLAGLGRSAEEAGLARVWMGDRTVYPVNYDNAGDLGDRFPWDPSTPQLEGVVAMTWLLSQTQRVGVGVTVMVLPLRQPVVLARQLATLDHLSGGRLTFGLGVGGVLEEFDIVGVDRARRGARTDEYIEAMRALWTEEQASYRGSFVNFPPTYCSPKPVQPGGVPLWIGGHGEAAYDRVAKYGAGLAPGGVSPERAAELLGIVRRKAEDLGRDPSSIGIVVMAGGTTGDDLRRLLEAHRDVGVTEMILPARGRSIEELHDAVMAMPELLQ